VRKAVFAVALGVLSALVLCGSAQAAGSVTGVITTAAALGNVVSAADNTDTIFTVNPSTGMVSRTGGTGLRLTTANTRALVTLTCNACGKAHVAIKIGPAGTPTLRARTLTNFTVAMGSAVLNTTPTTGSTITFKLNSFTNTATFYVGFDYPIAGDTSGLNSGAASSGFYVDIALDRQLPTTGPTSTVAASVFRPISLSNPRGLQFGTVVRPSSGTGSVAIDASSGALTPGGGAVALTSNCTTCNATYAVTGEGGQAFSLTIPGSFNLTTSGGTPITVALATSTPTGSYNLNSNLGFSGTFPFSIGGTMPVAYRPRTAPIAAPLPFRSSIIRSSRSGRSENVAGVGSFDRRA